MADDDLYSGLGGDGGGDSSRLDDEVDLYGDLNEAEVRRCARAHVLTSTSQQLTANQIHTRLHRMSISTLAWAAPPTPRPGTVGRALLRRRTRRCEGPANCAKATSNLTAPTPIFSIDADVVDSRPAAPAAHASPKTCAQRQQRCWGQ